MIKTSRLINNLSNKRYTLNIIKSNNVYISNTNIFKSSLINNNRSFHSSNQSYFLFDVLGKIKNALGGEKGKKEYPSNEKDLQDKTKSNLEQQNNNPTTTTTVSSTPEPQVNEEERKARLQKENEDYHKFLESGIKYDFNVFRQYLVQYKDQIKDQAKKQEIESHLRIIDCMTPMERENPFVFHKNAFKLRARLIKDSNTDIQTFASMINTYNSAKMLNDVLSSFKKQGKPIPNSAADIPTFFKSNAMEIKKEYDKIKATEARRL